MLQTQSTGLWLAHAAILEQLGFEPPTRLAWVRSARHLAGMLWLRGPEFFEPRDGRQEMRLELARHILEALELGVCPSGPVRYHPVEPGTAGDYYLNRYGALAEEAASLREKLRCLESLESDP